MKNGKKHSAPVRQSLLQGSAHPEGGPASSSPGTVLSTPAASAAASNCVCEHLGFISISFVHLLARCVLRCQKSLRAHQGVMSSIKLDIIKCFEGGE